LGIRFAGAIALLLLLGLVFNPTAKVESLLSDEEQLAWEEDINTLVARMEQMHPDLYFSISEADFQSAVEDVLSRLDKLSSDQVVLEIMKLVALINDGHTWLLPHQSALNYEIFPLRLYQFSDGFFVTDAIAEYQSAIGLELVAIGKTDIEAITEQLSSLVAHDNAMTVRERLPQFILTAGILAAADIIEGPTSATFTFEQSDGTQVQLELSPIPTSDYFEFLQPATSFTEIFPLMLPQDENVLYRSNMPSNFWSTTLEESNVLYVQYNAVQSVSVNEGSYISISAFSNELQEILDKDLVDRVIVDLRHNLGGDIGTFGPLFNLLADHPSLRQPNSVYLLIGRWTYSAAGIFTDRLRARTSVVLVGEPSGAGLRFYADNRGVILPKSRIEVRVSSRSYISARDDFRPWHEPDLLIEASSSDYFAGRDPVLQAALDED